MQTRPASAPALSSSRAWLSAATCAHTRYWRQAEETAAAGAPGGPSAAKLRLAARRRETGIWLLQQALEFPIAPSRRPRCPRQHAPKPADVDIDDASRIAPDRPLPGC